MVRKRKKAGGSVRKSKLPGVTKEMMIFESEVLPTGSRKGRKSGGTVPWPKNVRGSPLQSGGERKVNEEEINNSFGRGGYAGVKTAKGLGPVGRVAFFLWRILDRMGGRIEERKERGYSTQ